MNISLTLQLEDPVKARVASGHDAVRHLLFSSLLFSIEVEGGIHVLRFIQGMRNLAALF